MAEPNERTILLKTDNNKPEYVFHSANSRRKRVKKFQCCVCAICLCIFFSIISIIVLCKINFIDNKNNATNTTITADDKQLFTINDQLNFSSIVPLNDFHYKNVTINDVNEWEAAINAGKLELNKRDLIESVQPSLLLRSPSYRHQKVTATNEKARNISRIGYILEYATRYHQQNYGHSFNKTTRICNNNNNVSDNIINYNQLINYNVNCNAFQKYRSYNGTCNNLNNPSTYGVAYMPFRRVLPPDYADGISMPRISETGNPLPSARTVSLIVHRPYYKDDNKFSVMLAVWGQFLDHDITATALSQKANGSTISCCDIIKKSPECFPVLLDNGDPFRNYNIDCIEFVRSAPAVTKCLGPREQLNQATSFIDGSVIYGVDEDTVNKLRTFNNGLLKMYITEDNRTLLPVSDNINDGCNREEQRKNGRYCFLTGDARANENLHLTSMHLLWARQHNLLAEKLNKLNPHWSDERVFQEVRHIISGQMQHITYNEFLPILFGRKLMETFDLTTYNKSRKHNYNNKLNPSIANYFATAAFRFAHTIIPGLMKLLANDTTSPEYIQLHKMLFDPFKLYVPGEMDRVLRGAMYTNIEASDPYFTNELKQHLFEKAGEKNHSVQLCGLDLVSLNIQRGRDHGLPGYTKWRQYCQLETPNSFNDLKNYMDSNSVDNIRSIYSTVNDIDLYTGALSEIPLNGSILGPTITCLLLDQFVRIKFGDRFWYEHKNVFTPEQLNEIKKTTLANIICDNSDNVVYLQEKVMEKISLTNRNISCNHLNSPNLNLWKENLTHVSMSEKFLQIVIKN